MSWEDLTRSKIIFTSPEGNIFSALWKANERTVEKKLGTFDPPKFRGTVVQDLDTKSIAYPLTVYFEGASHYTDAEDFFTALSEEKGTWEIIHPTKGILFLQLTSARELIDPVGNGNFTVFETQWLEPALVDFLISPEQLLIMALMQAVSTFNDAITSLYQFRSDAYSAVQSAVNTMNRIAGFSEAVMAELAALDAVVSDAWNEAKDSFNALIDSFTADPSNAETLSELGQSVIDVISIPLQAYDVASYRYSKYAELIEDIQTLSPSGTTEEDYNKVVFQELGLTASLVSLCQIILTSTFSTRSQIISAMDKMTSAFNDTIATLESVQDNFVNSDIDAQYFSCSVAYGSMQKLYSLTMQYLINQFYNLKTEKRFTLKNPRSPLEITVTEYGSTGENDANYDLFISSNELSGNEILLLPAGREVVIYV